MLAFKALRSVASNIGSAMDWQGWGKQLMTLDPETLSMVRAALLASAAVLAIAKISRQCSAEGLRRRLRLMEAELFEFARLGHVGFGEPAYLLLRRQPSQRWLGLAGFQPDARRAGSAARSRRLEVRESPAADASLGGSARPSLRLALQGARLPKLHRQLLRTVWTYLTLGAIPFAACFCHGLVPVLDRLKGRRAPIGNTRLLEAYACTLTGLPIR